MTIQMVNFSEKAPSSDVTNVVDDSNGHVSSGESAPDTSKGTVQVEDERDKYRQIHGIKVGFNSLRALGDC